MSDQRKYIQSHGFIDFRANLQPASPRFWILLGAIQAHCASMAGVPLRPDVARQLQQLYLAKGVQATVAIEGNTLTEDEVAQAVEGRLHVPPSKEYLRREAENVAGLYVDLHHELVTDPDLHITPDYVRRINATILSGLDHEDHVEPGATRRIDVGVGPYKAAPWEDCDYLLERLCQWLGGVEFAPPSGDQRIAYGVLRAIIAHVYIAWIHPFGDGNGRTARALEFALLFQCGIPLTCTYCLSNHYGMTRLRYYREIDRSHRQQPEGLIRFLEYALEGFLDGLVEQSNWVRWQHRDVAWNNYVYQWFHLHTTLSPSAQRRRSLLLALSDENDWIDFETLPLRARQADPGYRSLTGKALTRDLNELERDEFIVQSSRGIRVRKEMILAFAAPSVNADSSFVAPESNLRRSRSGKATTANA